MEMINTNSFRLTAYAEEYALYSYQTDKVISTALNLDIDGIYEFGMPVNQAGA
jgi:hypothetical protein